MDSNQTIMNNRPGSTRRWTVLLGGFLLSAMGGMSYAWGSFVIPLVNDWGWTVAEATLPLTILIVVFALMMIPAGWLQDRIGPRKIALAGAVLFLVGYGLASLLRYITTHTWLIATYGLLVGSACGLTYACIAPVARKWYPDRPGFAVSTAVMGFGLAAVVFAPLKKVMIRAWGVDGALLVLGVFVFAVALAGALLMRNPPDGWIPPPKQGSAAKAVAARRYSNQDIPPGQFIRMPVFYGLWAALAAVIGGGLTAIGLLTPFGEIQLHLSPTEAAMAVSVFSLVNGIGRPLAGYCGDRFGANRVMIVVYSVQAVVFLAMPWVVNSYPLLLLSALLLGAGYAVTFALFPVLVAAGFGTRHLGTNYGLVFSAFGIGALTGYIGSMLLDRTGSFTPAFLLAGTTTLIGLVLLIMLHKSLDTSLPKSDSPLK